MSVHADYLYDVGLELKQRALEALKARNAAPKESAERTFQSGRLMAFNEVISILQQEATGLGLPLKDLRLDDIEPDRDLT